MADRVAALEAGADDSLARPFGLRELVARLKAILRFMATRPGRVLRRAEIIQEALGKNTDGLSRTIDVHMAAIRRKLGRNANFITTVRGVGYKITEPLSALGNRERA